MATQGGHLKHCAQGPGAGAAQLLLDVALKRHFLRASDECQEVVPLFQRFAWDGVCSTLLQGKWLNTCSAHVVQITPNNKLCTYCWVDTSGHNNGPSYFRMHLSASFKEPQVLFHTGLHSKEKFDFYRVLCFRCNQGLGLHVHRWRME